MAFLIFDEIKTIVTLGSSDKVAFEIPIVKCWIFVGRLPIVEVLPFFEMALPVDAMAELANKLRQIVGVKFAGTAMLNIDEAAAQDLN